MSDGEDPDLNQAEVEPSDYLRKARHKSINDLRTQVYQARMRAYDARREGYDVDTTNDIIRSAVENYITELEPVLVNTEAGQPYWEEVSLGTVDIWPPDGQEFDQEGYEYELVGLRDFQNAQSRFRGTFTYQTNSHTKGSQVMQVTEEVSLPESVSWTAFRYANQFAYEIGLDIDHKKEVAVEAEPF